MHTYIHILEYNSITSYCCHTNRAYARAIRGSVRSRLGGRGQGVQPLPLSNGHAEAHPSLRGRQGLSCSITWFGRVVGACNTAFWTIVQYGLDAYSALIVI